MNQRFNSFSDPPGPPGSKRTDIERLYYISSMLNVQVKSDAGDRFIEDWKLEIGDAQVATIDLVSEWVIAGTAEGGNIEVALTGPSGACNTVVTTLTGESAETVVANVAAAVNADPCVASQGISASSDGSTLILTAPIAAVTVSSADPGLAVGPKVEAVISSLTAWGLSMMVVFILLVGAYSIRTRQLKDAH